ncbi:MAG: RNA methyltransferase [Lachnospiraceae bacterium]|nr:RNA methyltransferase [Lachnospiraceae bacterium]
MSKDMQIETIVSKENPKVKELCRLRDQARERRRRGLFLAEGEKLAQELPPAWLSSLYMTPEYFHAHQELAAKLAGEKPFRLLSEELMRKVCDVETPQGILAVAQIPEWDLGQALSAENPLLLVLEDIQDPGNLGTMLRLSEGAGVLAVFGVGKMTDCWQPKAVRSAMGSLFRVPYFQVGSWEDLVYIKSEMAESVTVESELTEGISLKDFFHSKGIRLYAADLASSEDYGIFDYQEAAAFLIGNEAHGLSEEARGLSDKKVKIPMQGTVQSMNAAMAAAILLFEAARQRRLR